MSEKSHRCRPLALSLGLALALMGTMATSAWAGEFRVKGGTFTSKGVASESFSGTGGLYILSIASGLTYHCTGSDASGTELLGGTKHFFILYSGCTVVGNKQCTIYPTSADAEKGTNAGHYTVVGLASVVLHNFLDYLVSLVSIWKIFQKGKLCTLPEEIELSGSMAMKMPAALEELVNQKLETVGSATEELLGTQLFAGAEKATPGAGSTTTVHLSGENTGKTWGAE